MKDKHDYLLNSRRIHLIAITIMVIIAAFLRWYRLDNCVLCSGDEWLAIGPTFDFLEKFFRNPFTAIGFELSAVFPFSDIGRIGPPFLYTRSLVLIWTMPYYAIVGLFHFPIDESWYRFPGTIWSLLGLWSTYYFVYWLTLRRVTAFFAFALQATLLAHLVQSRFLVADGVFVFWFALAAGLWMKFLRDKNPRTRHLAYLTTMFYASSTPEALIGLTAIFTLVVFWLWQEDYIDPLKKPLAAIQEIRRIFIAWSALWLIGFFTFQILVEIKIYLQADACMPLSYLGRFLTCRGAGGTGFFPERVIDWYLYPHISLPVIIAALFSLLLVKQKKWRAVLAFGWLWALFWVMLTLFVPNSSSNFTRIMHAVLVLSAAGLTTLYDIRPRLITAFAVLLIAGNLYGIYTYPLLCSADEDENVAQAVGYLVQRYNTEWGGSEKIGFYFPTGSLYAYMPEGSYTEIDFHAGEQYTDCITDIYLPSVENLDVIIALPDDYNIRQQLNKLLDYAVMYDCEQQRLQAINTYARNAGFQISGKIIADDGKSHALIWSRIPVEIGDIDLEEANRLHYEHYSRNSWFKP